MFLIGSSRSHFQGNSPLTFLVLVVIVDSIKKNIEGGIKGKIQEWLSDCAAFCRELNVKRWVVEQQSGKMGKY